jgi:predicted RND superfamily exporter protein
MSLATFVQNVMMGMFEGYPKWNTLTRDQAALNATTGQAGDGTTTLFNSDCSMTPLVIYLTDHRAETLQLVVDEVTAFGQKYNSAGIHFKLAAGNAGVAVATNQEIAKAQTEMLILVYAVVSILIFLSFRSIKAVICIVIPLMLTSILCQALMAHLGIGVKVATLPVIALGVGIGVDYGIYIFSRMAIYLKQGMDVEQAYHQALKTTGKAVILTGITLAIAVATWVFSPIKFQADMGILLTFMFLWNMIGALWLSPALARVLIRPKGKSDEFNPSEQEALSTLAKGT